MVDRIIMSSDGIRVSKAGYDAGSAAPDNMAMYSGMLPCIPLLSSTATFTGKGTQTFSFINSSGQAPMVLLRSPQGVMPSHLTYFARIGSPYNSVTINNFDGQARTIEFKILL